jgi:hypothetical protein
MCNSGLRTNIILGLNSVKHEDWNLIRTYIFRTPIMVPFQDFK